MKKISNQSERYPSVWIVEVFLLKLFFYKAFISFSVQRIKFILHLIAGKKTHTKASKTKRKLIKLQTFSMGFNKLNVGLSIDLWFFCNDFMSCTVSRFHISTKISAERQNEKEKKNEIKGPVNTHNQTTIACPRIKFHGCIQDRHWIE